MVFILLNLLHFPVFVNKDVPEREALDIARRVCLTEMERIRDRD